MGANRLPAFPAPSFNEGEAMKQSSGEQAARMRTFVCTSKANIECFRKYHPRPSP
ncbi:hypothetical protein GA0061098_1007292 [Bradyrhizobium shewense]|uniref:Uncharacterized protein n=1 Tax=Bradyrhizobium shewense TaxID=1761772 RepID=A0A1C3WF74_9BRAD|nr:hypothetical protein GA0061098_1007292 [Bradyrhizobium shewense]